MGDIEQQLALYGQESSDPSQGQTLSTSLSRHHGFPFHSQLCRQEQLSAYQPVVPLSSDGTQYVNLSDIFTPSSLCRQKTSHLPSGQATVHHLNSSTSAFIPSELLSVPEPDAALHLLRQILAGKVNPAKRPNLDFNFPLFNHQDVPAAKPLLHLEAWKELLASYPDQEVAAQLVGAIEHGICLGYKGVFENEGRLSKRNLPLTSEGKAHVEMEIQDRLRSGRLQEVFDPQGLKLVCSPIGTVPKPNSDKLCTIHHLSHPHKGNSINAGINDEHATIQYEGLDQLIEFVRNNRGAKLWKADLKEAFRSVGVALSQARLLGFAFQERFFMECALAFGC